MNPIRLIILIAMTTFWMTQSWALDACIGKGAQAFNLDHQGVAVNGYDPVAFFTEGKAMEGSDQIITEICGVTYYFSSEENRELFLQNPSQYEPGFGGWNPYSMSLGAFTSTNPEFFDVSTGRLLLFINKTTRQRYLKSSKTQMAAKEFFDDFLKNGQ